MNLWFYVELYMEFFKVGLFSIGGGLATIPFLQEMGARTGWFTMDALANMIALSESTPGPMGINMATYVGFETGGVLGGMVATVGTITPSLVIIVIISGFLEKFQKSRVVQGIFYGIRPASAALIGSAALQVAEVAFMKETAMGQVIYPNAVLVGIGLCGLMYVSPCGKWHPVTFLLLGGILGGLFSL